MQKIQGIIYQSISGFYYVWSQGRSYVSRPKGLFRHTKEKPLVGDRVIVEIDPNDAQSEGRLIEIEERKNKLIRPSISNVDYALVVTSLVEPEFSFNLLDQFLVGVESFNIEAIVILTKYDLLVEKKGEEAAQSQLKDISAIYSKIGYTVKVFKNDQASMDEIALEIKEGIHVVMGQSGVGKSTILNYLLPKAKIETAEISQSLNRGRHTTREVTLYPYNDGLLADTPGFSAVDFPHLEKEDLQYCFPEIQAASVYCQFRSCLHLKEPKCEVKNRVSNGEIVQSRYDNYVQLFKKIEERKPMYPRNK